MSHDVFTIIPEPTIHVRQPVRVRATLPEGWGTGPFAPSTALEAAQLLQAEGKRVCLVFDGDHTCLTDGRPSLADLP